MSLLLADANVLIDLGVVAGLRLLPLLGRCEVLSTVLVECQHASQPTLVAEIAAAGILTVDVERSLVEAADAHPAPLLSLQDRQCLIYARDQGRVLLTGDQHLRVEAGGAGVPCHGTIWLVEQAVASGAFSPSELCRWLEHWPLRRRRLPQPDLARLRILIGCPPP